MLIEARADRKECPPAVESDTAATAADEKPTAIAEPPEAKADGSFVDGRQCGEHRRGLKLLFFFLKLERLLSFFSL